MVHFCDHYIYAFGINIKLNRTVKSKNQISKKIMQKYGILINYQRVRNELDRL